MIVPEIVISFIISLAAGNIPTIKDAISKNISIDKALKKCFRRAVDKWDVIEEMKQSNRDNHEKFLSELRDYISNSPIGRHPKLNELLYLWANEIKDDPTASSFVSQIQQDLDLKISQEIKDIVSHILQENKNNQEDLQRILAIVNPFRGEGVKSIKEYWDYWATGDNFILHSDLVLGERDEMISKIVKSASIPGVYTVAASSVSEAIAFVCAALLLCNEHGFRNAYVITKENSYERVMATNPSGVIFVTDLDENHYVAANNGNVVFRCELKKGNGLPELSPDAFAKAIEKSLSKNVEAYHLARQGGYDVVSLRRILKIENKNPNWLTPTNIDVVTDMCMLGGWNESVRGDRDIIENFTNQKYDDFIAQISPLLKVDNAPIIKIGTEWKVKSPIDLFSLILDRITDRHIDKLSDQIPYLSMDTDPEALEKLEETGLRFHTNNQMISSSLKHGIYGNMAILTNIFEYHDPDKADRIKRIVADELSTYDLTQYLSNRRYINYFAATNSKAFLDFIINDIQKGGGLLDALFKGRKKEFSLTGYEINYTELIHSLECIALDKCFLYEVTYILFYAMKYPKVANYVDSVKDLLGRIYQFVAPQTEATFAERFDVLVQLKTANPKEVFWVLCHMIDSITDPQPFVISQGFHSQIYRRKKELIYPTTEEVCKVLSLIPEVFSPIPDDYLKCLDIAMRRSLGDFRNALVDFLTRESVNFKRNVQIIDEIEKEIVHHECYPNAEWSLSEAELLPFKTIYEILCSEDKVLLYRKYFCHELPIQATTFNHKEYIECEIKSNVLRGFKIQDLEETLGIDSVWAFAGTVENPKSVFEGLSTLTNPKYSLAVYAAMTANKIETINAEVYFTRLYYRIGETEYLKLIDKFNLLDNSGVSVPLYAPSWTDSLALKAKELGPDVNRQYWENVRIWQQPNDFLMESVIHNLLDSKREWDIISIITGKDVIKQINLELKIRILKGAIINLRESNSRRDFYNYNKILLSIRDKEIIGTIFEKDILEIEGFLFQALNDHLNPGEELHIVRALKWDANLMIDLLKSYGQLNTEDTLVGSELLYKFVNDVNFTICQRDDGSIDFDNVVNYLSTLISCKDLPLSYVLIGNLLYAIMTTPDEPSKEFCNVIETLADDDIDQHLYFAIYNSRGVTCHGCFEGGKQERVLAERYAEMSKKVRPYSLRLKNVFDNLKTSYLADAKRMDEEALRNKYR